MMMTASLLSVWSLALLVAVAVTARHEYLLSADNPFRRAPRVVVWRDRVPSLLAILWIPLLVIGVPGEVPIGWQAPTTAGGVLILLAVCLLGQWNPQPEAGSRAALLRPRSTRAMMPRILAPLAAVGVLVAIGLLAWLAVAGGERAPSPCEAIRSGSGFPRSHVPEMLSMVAALWAIALLGGCVVLAAWLAGVATLRPAAGNDAEVDGELRRRAVVRAVAGVGIAAALLIAVACVGVLARYPAAFESCSTTNYDPERRVPGSVQVWEAGIVSAVGLSVIMLFAAGLLVFSLYRFVAPTQGWRPAAQCGVGERR